MQDKTLVIIPTYNEKENAENIIRKVFSLQDPFHILVIDDPNNFSLWKINYLFYDKRDNVGQKVSVMLPLGTKAGEKRYHFFFVIDNWKDM